MTTARRAHVDRSDYGAGEMNETCDRCGPAVRAAYRVQKRGELYLCRHCAMRLWPTLSGQGRTLWPVDAHALAPQTYRYADADAGRNPGARA
jgi:ribosomal protein S14